ncbi:MAG: dUTP diphosphatase [Agathobacter sp.]|nr:dUTP diphosphatase [Agathobacter sp.]MBQ2284009.1 dUTP diphosphatase [Agathobacter sp.]
MEIKLKKLSETAKVPTRGSEYAAGYDLYADIEEKLEVKPHSTVKIGTGLAMSIPHGYFGAVFARSGLATKESLRPANCTAVIDSDYTGEWFIPLHNDSDEVRYVMPHDRIAQLVVMPFMPAEFEEVEELDSTQRGAGGFGSTGKQ